MKGCEITTTEPFRSLDVVVFPDGTMPLSHFAHIIGSTNSTVKHRAGDAVRTVEKGVYISRNGQYVEKLIELDAIGHLLVDHYNYSEKDADIAMRQLWSACENADPCQEDHVPSKKKRSHFSGKGKEEFNTSSSSSDEEEVVVEPKKTIRLSIPQGIKAALQKPVPLPPVSPSVLMAPTEPNTPIELDTGRIDEHRQDFLIKSELMLTENVKTFISHMQKASTVLIDKLADMHQTSLNEYKNSEEFQQKKDALLEEYRKSEEFKQKMDDQVQKVVKTLTPLIEERITTRLEQEKLGMSDLNLLIDKHVDDAVSKK